MSKFYSTTVKKTPIWSVIIGLILAAGIIIGTIFGVNQSLEMKDKKTLTVSLNAYVYNTQLDEVKEDLMNELNAEYALEGTMSGDVSEIVFVFEKTAVLSSLKTKAAAYLDAKFANTTAKYSVSTSIEKATSTLAKNYILRAAIASVVFAVLALVYVSIRYKLAGGIVACLSVLLSILTTAAIIILTRVYVSPSTVYAVTATGLLSVVMTLFTLNNVRSAQKAEGVSDEEAVVSSVATKEVLTTALIVAVGVLVAGILGKTAGMAFAVPALIGVAVAMYVSLLFAPAIYLSMKTAFDGKPVKGGYIGAKRTSKKAKKVYAAEEAVEEAPVEEAVEETAEEVEEAPVEETVEEATEEVEEAPVEEVIEETAEEVVEEVATEEVAEEETEE